jgi:hypothetical protein
MHRLLWLKFSSSGGLGFTEVLAALYLVTHTQLSKGTQLEFLILGEVLFPVIEKKVEVG